MYKAIKSTIIYVVFIRENLLCTAYCSWLAGLLDSLGVAEGIYTDISKWEVRTENSFSHQDMGQSCPSQWEKGVITSVSVLTYNHCTYFGYGHYEQSRSFTFEFWWRQNWLAFTQLWLTLHSCALYSVLVLLKLFMQITSVLITSAIITLDMDNTLYRDHELYVWILMKVKLESIWKQSVIKIEI